MAFISGWVFVVLFVLSLLVIYYSAGFYSNDSSAKGKFFEVMLIVITVIPFTTSLLFLLTEVVIERNGLYFVELEGEEIIVEKRGSFGGYFGEDIHGRFVSFDEAQKMEVVFENDEKVYTYNLLFYHLLKLSDEDVKVFLNTNLKNDYELDNMYLSRIEFKDGIEKAFLEIEKRFDEKNETPMSEDEIYSLLTKIKDEVEKGFPFSIGIKDFSLID